MALKKKIKVHFDHLYDLYESMGINKIKTWRRSIKHCPCIFCLPRQSHETFLLTLTATVWWYWRKNYPACTYIYCRYHETQIRCVFKQILLNFTDKYTFFTYIHIVSTYSSTKKWIISWPLQKHYIQFIFLKIKNTCCADDCGNIFKIFYVVRSLVRSLIYRSAMML